MSQLRSWPWGGAGNKKGTGRSREHPGSTLPTLQSAPWHRGKPHPCLPSDPRLLSKAGVMMPALKKGMWGIK